MSVIRLLPSYSGYWPVTLADPTASPGLLSHTLFLRDSLFKPLRACQSEKLYSFPPSLGGSSWPQPLTHLLSWVGAGEAGNTVG